MSLFNFGKKKEEKNAPACACSCECSASEADEIKNDCCPEAKGGICCVKVLGAGCKSCHEQYEYAKEAVKSMGLSVEVEYITDMQKVMEYGVMSLPALVVNEKVISMGKVLKAADVEKLLRKGGIMTKKKVAFICVRFHTKARCSTYGNLLDRELFVSYL